MTETQDFEALANEICGCATREQRKRDVARLKPAFDAMLAEVREALAEADRKNDALQHEWDRAERTIAEQAAELAKLREALKFYAREYSWRSCGMYMSGRSNPSSAEIDRGDKARAALKGSPDE
jgi:septal ring factor EnvC (AmiA/AmiB activator)